MTAPAPSPGPDEQGACAEFAECTTRLPHHTHSDAVGRSWCCMDLYPYSEEAAPDPTPAAPGTDHSGKVEAVAVAIGDWLYENPMRHYNRTALDAQARRLIAAFPALAARRPATEAEAAVRRVEAILRRVETAEDESTSSQRRLTRRIRAALAGDAAVGGGS